MEKLLELLNEYKETKKILNYDMDGQLEIDNAIYVNYPNIERLCGKQFGFIKRLVENDNIDIDKIDKKIRIYDYVEEYEEYDYVFPDIYKQLLMLLSISDTPIEDLISYLK